LQLELGLVSAGDVLEAGHLLLQLELGLGQR
jgi:hypothetical protein